MKDEKMECKNCEMHCGDSKGMTTCHVCAHKNKGHILITVGIVALVYAFVNYLRMTVGFNWPPYTGWAIGGVLLVVIGWVKAYLMRKCC